MVINEGYLTIGKTSIYYKAIGPENPKATLVLLHDSLGCTVLWRDWLELLATALGIQVLSYDRRGYGLSSKFDEPRTIDYLEQEAVILDQLIDQLQLKNVHLFGFSDGGSVATIYAGMFPDRIKSLVIEGVHVLLEPQTLEGVRLAKHAFDTTKIGQVLQKYHGDKVETLYLAWTETWLSTAHQTWNIEHFIPLIKVPILVIQGEFDEFGTIAQMDAFDAATKVKVEKFLVEGVSHTAHKEKKAEVFDKVVTFVAQNL